MAKAKLTLQNSAPTTSEDIQKQADERKTWSETRTIKDYSLFCDGDFDPFMQKHIKKLFVADETYIVYLDEADDVTWAFTESEFKPSNSYSDVVSRVSYLQSMSTFLDDEQRLRFRSFLAEIIKFVIEDKRNDPQVYSRLDQAEQYLAARSREQARIYYFRGGLVTTAVFLILTLATWMRVSSSFGDSYVGDAFLCLGMGAVGALISLVLPHTSARLDRQAGASILQIEGMLRVTLGALAGFLVSLAINANVFLSFLDSKGLNASQSNALLLLIAVIAGTSERLLPSLVKRVEQQTTIREVSMESGTQTSPPKPKAKRRKKL
jgi:hypothetical protein